MKKVITMILSACMCVSLLAGCGGGTPGAESATDQTQSQSPALETAEDYAIALKASGCNIDKIEVYTEETDPNQIMGRPGQYISKVDFSDSTLDQSGSIYLVGGTIEVFANKQECENRYKYLQNFEDASMGAFGLNQYMYKGDTVILRVSYDVTPSESKSYESAFNNLLER